MSVVKFIRRTLALGLIVAIPNAFAQLELFEDFSADEVSALSILAGALVLIFVLDNKASDFLTHIENSRLFIGAATLIVAGFGVLSIIFGISEVAVEAVKLANVNWENTGILLLISTLMALLWALSKLLLGGNDDES